MNPKIPQEAELLMHHLQAKARELRDNADIALWTLTGGPPLVPSLALVGGHTEAELVGKVYPEAVKGIGVTIPVNGRSGPTGSAEVHAVLRNGHSYHLELTEDEASSRASEGDARDPQAQSLVYHARRSLGLRSQAIQAPIDQIRRRAIAAAAIDMILEGATADESRWVAHNLHGEARHVAQTIGEMRYGLSAGTWEEAREQALRQAAVIDNAEGTVGPLSRYLAWCDADLWAYHCAEAAPTLEEAREQLLLLARQGLIADADYEALVATFLTTDPP